MTVYYAVNSALMLHYKYSLEELENMIPWERIIYLKFVEQYVKEKNNQINQVSGGKIEYAE